MAAVVSQWTELLVNTSVTPFVPLLSTAVTVTNMDNSAATCYSDITGAATLGSNVVNTDAAGNLTLFLNPVGGDGTSRYKLTPSGLGTIIVQVGPRDSDLEHRSSGPTRIDFTSPRFGGISGSDWSPAINLALAVGGILTCPPGTYNISLNHAIPNGVAIQCDGGGITNAAVTFKTAAAGAGITVSGSGPVCSGFRVDGNSVALTPLQVGTSASPGAQRTFIDVTVIGSAQDNWTVLYAQNALFLGCNSQSATRDNLYISGSAAGLSFDRFESNTATRNGLRVDCAIDGTAQIGVAYPQNVTFHRSIFEGTGGANPQVVVQNAGAGGSGPLRIMFDHCIIAAHPTSPVTVDILNVSAVNLDNCTIFAPASGTAAIRVNTNSLVYLRNPWFYGGSPNCAAVLNFDATASIFTEGEMKGLNPLGSGFTAGYGGAGTQETQVRLRIGNPVEISRASAETAVVVRTAAGVNQWLIAGNGLMYWYTAGGVADTSLGWGGGSGGLVTSKGVGFWAHAAPTSQPAAPVTLADVIAVIRGCGLSA